MNKLNKLKEKIKGKEMNFMELEGTIITIYDVYEKDTIFNGDNKYYAFENNSHSYEVLADKEYKDLNIQFEYEKTDSFDMYEDKITVINVEYV